MAPEGRMFTIVQFGITYTQSLRILIVILAFIYFLMDKEVIKILCFALSKIAFLQNQERMI